MAEPLALPLIALAGYGLCTIVVYNPTLQILAGISMLLAIAAVNRQFFLLSVRSGPTCLADDSRGWIRNHVGRDSRSHSW